MSLRRKAQLMTGRKLSVSTLFSGAEVFFVTVQILLAVINRHYGTNVTAELDWIVEKDSWKRSFVQQRTPPKAAFEDIISLADNGWTGIDTISNTEKTLWQTSINAAGFECDTICKLSKAENRSDCMERMEACSSVSAG
jgi:hypothetical protein